MFGCVEFPEDLVRRARAGYNGLITYLDEKIGTLLQTLDETGQLENTVVIYTSDHGEMNGEHGMWRKSNFYEASSRVPLQVMFPDKLSAGKRIDDVVSLVDLTATLVDIAGGKQREQFDGEMNSELILTMTVSDMFCIATVIRRVIDELYWEVASVGKSVRKTP